MQILWLVSFLLFKNKVTQGKQSPRLPASEIYYWNKLLFSQIPEIALMVRFWKLFNKILESLLALTNQGRRKLLKSEGADWFMDGLHH